MILKNKKKSKNRAQKLIRKRTFKIANSDTIKIFAFCDNHGDKRIFKTINDILIREKITCIICAGDFTTVFKEFQIFLHKFNSFNIPFFFIHGNHEDVDKIMEYLRENYLKNIVFIHKNLIKFKNICITGFGGEGFSYETPSLQKNIIYLKKDIENTDCKFKIFVTHAPPYSTKLDCLHNRFCGNQTILNAIKSIGFDLSISGHIHENSNILDKINGKIILNPGREGCIISLDKKYKIKSIKFLGKPYICKTNK